MSNMDIAVNSKISVRMWNSDPFIESLRDMIGGGRLISMSESALKADLVIMVQTHSAEVPYIQGDISRSFLTVCDLMLNGDLSKLNGHSLKAFLLLVLYEKEVSDGRRMLATIKEQAGIEDDSTLYSALEVLKGLGYIDSAESPCLAETRVFGRKRTTEADKMLLFS